MERFFKRAVVLASLVALGSSALAPAQAEPITVGLVLFTIGTGIAVGIATNELGSNYLNIAHGYATPEADSNLVWTLGRNNGASALDFDSGPKNLDSRGTACANAGFIWDTVDAKNSCAGTASINDYFNAARIWKNGQINENDVGGTAPEGQADKLRVNIEGLPAQQDVRLDMHTGKIGSLIALVGGGATFDGSQWVRWRPEHETDPVVRDYLSGAMPPDAGAQVPSFAVASTDELFAANDAHGAVDWFPYFLAAVSAAGTFSSDGQLFYNDFSFDVPLAQAVDLDGTWYSSVQAMQANAVPEPSTYLMLGAGLALLVGMQRARRKQAARSG